MPELCGSILAGSRPPLARTSSGMSGGSSSAGSEAGAWPGASAPPRSPPRSPPGSRARSPLERGASGGASRAARAAELGPFAAHAAHALSLQALLEDAGAAPAPSLASFSTWGHHHGGAAGERRRPAERSASMQLEPVFSQGSVDAAMAVADFESATSCSAAEDSQASALSDDWWLPAPSAGGAGAARAASGCAGRAPAHSMPLPCLALPSGSPEHSPPLASLLARGCSLLQLAAGRGVAGTGSFGAGARSPQPGLPPASCPLPRPPLGHGAAAVQLKATASQAAMQQQRAALCLLESELQQLLHLGKQLEAAACAASPGSAAAAACDAARCNHGAAMRRALAAKASLQQELATAEAAALLHGPAAAGAFAWAAPAPERPAWALAQHAAAARQHRAVSRSMTFGSLQHQAPAGRVRRSPSGPLSAAAQGRLQQLVRVQQMQAVLHDQLLQLLPVQ
ncbi:hypothetical protein HT031_004550 [Scenedesmus sp. PABB004]|nr:hypothetical protein HT031_004550 [Scenedesmus sp. PABB004]